MTKLNFDLYRSLIDDVLIFVKSLIISGGPAPVKGEEVSSNYSSSYGMFSGLLGANSSLLRRGPLVVKSVALFVCDGWSGFIRKVANAIDVRGVQCKLIESRWVEALENNSFSLVLAPDSLLSGELSYLYNRESGTICGVRLLPLMDVSIYDKEPQLKKILWGKICEILSLQR